MGLFTFKDYIGYKLTVAIDKSNLMPLAFLLHEGSPNDAKLFYQILKELKKRRVIREGDVLIADKLLQLQKLLKILRGSGSFP